MYPQSSSSQNQNPIGASSGGGLTRYGSAPSSLIATAVDSVIGPEFLRSSQSQLLSGAGGIYFPGESSSLTGDSVCNKVGSSSLFRSHGLNEIAARIGPNSSASSSSSSTTSSSPSASASASTLLRQRSSPAGFFNHLSATDKNGFLVPRGSGGYGSQGGLGASRLKSQLSFNRQDSLSQISEVSENVMDGIGSENAMHSFGTTSFGMDSWDNNTTSIHFSGPPSKRAKDMDGDMYGLETQTTLEMAAVEKLLHIPEDSVPCKIRAKRGCATHPRSIAERERRTRISGKLKKLQDLVPNMDKQTSYADMLDLAVQHIKGLQNQVQKLHKELDSCTCGCKQAT